jgi:hypothetical protein
MKTILTIFISIVFCFSSFAQDVTGKTVKDSFALSYTFTSNVKNERKMQDNTYLRKVEIYKTNVTEKIMKYDFLCMKFEIKGSNNVKYIKKVADVFDEISILVDANGKIIDVTKPTNMDERWLEAKEKILLDYKGKAITNYLKQVDETIEDKEKLMAFLQSDNMYGLFIKGLSELENLSESSKIKIKRKEGIKIITPKTESNEETEQYTFKDDVLNYAFKTLGNIKYEIKFLEQIK